MTDRHLSWNNLQNLIVSGAPARVRIPGTPRLEIMMESGGTALSLLIPFSAVGTIPVTALDSIRIETVRIDSEEYVRVVTRVRPLYQEFYLLLTEIADSIQLDDDPLDVAIRKRLESWKELLRSIGLLSAEQQLGLLGELWLLQRLIFVYGPQALESWIGPVAEPHDFRFSGTELEVKTTKNRQRLHIINGLAQLTPSTGMKLYLLSIQLEPANTEDAISLAGIVSAVRDALAADTERTRSFDRIMLEGCAYRTADEQHYRSTFRLRSHVVLIPVDETFPKLTRDIIREALGDVAEQRIAEVRYSVNVDELGFVDGSPEFHAVLPVAKPHDVAP